MLLHQKFILLIISFLLIQANAFGKEPSIYEPKGFKGQFYFSWGYNRGYYTNSDIRFHGSDYDFTLSNVVSHDKPSPVGYDPYFKIDKITIPQTNLRIGYFFKNHWSISLGDDHMKYVMTQNQEVEINGEIKNSDTEYNGTYNNQSIVLADDFLKFEHTDGLNYINLELRRQDAIISLSKYHIANIDLNVIEGIGSGVMVPRTNTTLLSQERYDEFHLSGFGISAMAGLNITLWDHLFFQSEVKAGYINMPDIRTTASSSDKAAQHFYFTQVNLLVGYSFRIFKPAESQTPK